MVKWCCSKRRKPIVPLRDLSLRAAVLPMSFLLDCALQTPCAQFAQLACSSTLHHPESSYPGSAPRSCAARFPLMLTALRELGRQDFTLLLSLEQNLTSARERTAEGLNHLETQRAGFRSGTAGRAGQPYRPEKALPAIRISPMGFKHAISLPADLCTCPSSEGSELTCATPVLCLSNHLTVSFFNQPCQCKEQVFHFRINLPNSTLPKG